MLLVMAAAVAVPQEVSARPASYYVDSTVGVMGPVALVGDSLTISSWYGLPGEFVRQGWGPFQLEARSARRALVPSSIATSGIEGIRHIRSSGFDAPVWVVALGTNDMNVVAAQPGGAVGLINTVLDEIGPGHRVVWVNVYASGFLANSVQFNAALNDVAAIRPTLTVADWFTLIQAHPEWLYPDGIHPNATGAAERNQFVAREALRGRGSVGVAGVPTGAQPHGPPAGLQRVHPTRIFDSNAGGGPLGGGVTYHVDLPPEASAASAAVVNLTPTGRGMGGYVVAWDCDPVIPPVSSVNYSAATSRSATTIVSLDASHGFCVRSYATADLVIDLEELLTPASGLMYRPSNPQRLLDTRELPRQAQIGPGDEVRVTLPSVEGVAAKAALVNVTATRAVASSTVTVRACDETATPGVLTTPPVTDVANAYWVNADVEGAICVTASSSTDVLIDLSGLFVEGPGSLYQPAVPVRLLDTRSGIGRWLGMPSPFQTLDISLLGLPPTVQATIVTVTMTEPYLPGHTRIWPCSGSLPEVSTSNFVAGSTVANLAATSADPCITASTGAHLVVDLVGWFVAAAQ